jgi:predicted kinase
MAPLVIPDPSLVLLIGAAGSGKSTLAARLFAADEILSSDALRAVVAGDEADQTATGVAFRILHRTLDRRLREGRLTVIDATNALAGHRAPLLRRARAVDLPVIAFVLDLPPTDVHAQNAGRARVVDPSVIDRHLASLRRTIDGGVLEREGYASVVMMQTPGDVAGLEIERQVATGPAG